MYLLVNPVCLRGFTIMGKTITPTVKTKMGATTINIDSKDMKQILFTKQLAGLIVKVMRIYI